MYGALPNQFRSLSPCGHHRFRDVTGEKEPMAGQRSMHSPPRAPTVGIHLEAGHTERRRETRRGGERGWRVRPAARAGISSGEARISGRLAGLGHFPFPPLTGRPLVGAPVAVPPLRLEPEIYGVARRAACCERASILQSLAKILGAGPCQEPPGLPFLVI